MNPEREPTAWPPRVLHIGNIANNAYMNARILNAAGVPSDVLCYDYYHSMGCPEWEEGDIRRLPGDFNENRPLWHRLVVHDFRRPEWFSQGPFALAVRYLRARRGGLRLPPGFWRTLLRTWARFLAHSDLEPEIFRIPTAVRSALGLGLGTGVLQWLRHHLAARRSKDSLDDSVALFVARFRALFPERADALTPVDLANFHVVARKLRRLMARYDVVIGYATDCIWPMLVQHPCYMAYEHGTIRALPFEDSALGRLTAMAYRTAACSFITNCDNLLAARRLGLENARFIPHPGIESLLARVDGGQVRRDLEARFGTDFVVFHPSRHHWEARRHPSWEKGNDIFLKGFARFVREVNPRALAVLVRWGQTIGETERLLAEEGVAHRVHWVPTMPNRRMLELIRASDVVADQFWLGAFGAITPKALACGRPVLLKLDEEVHRRCFAELPPVLQSRSPEEVFEALARLHRDPAFRREVGARSEAWYRGHHSEAVIREALLSALRRGVTTGAAGPRAAGAP